MRRLRPLMLFCALASTAACTKQAAVSGSTRSESDKDAGTDDGGSGAGPVSGAIADADFTQANEPTAISGTNLTGTAAADAVRVEQLMAGGSGWTPVGEAPVRDGAFTAGPVDPARFTRFVALRAGVPTGLAAFLPPLRGVAAGVVLSPSGGTALALFTAMLAVPSCAELIRAALLDAPALWHLAALFDAATRRGGPRDLAPLVAPFCAANKAAVAGAADAAARLAAGLAAAAPPSLAADAVAGRYDARLSSKPRSGDLGTVRATIALAHADPAADQALKTVQQMFVFFRALDARPAAGAAGVDQLFMQVLALPPEAFAAQVDGKVSDDVLAGQVVAAPASTTAAAPAETTEAPGTSEAVTTARPTTAPPVTAAADAAPTITPPPPAAVDEDHATDTAAFTVGDAETPADALTLSASSNNPGLIADDHIQLGGSGRDRTIRATPAADQAGTATIRITVSDGARSASADWVVTVAAVDDAPSLTAPADATVDANTDAGPYDVPVGDVETAAGALVLTATSSDQALVADAGITLGGAGAGRTVRVRPQHDAHGTATITLRAADPGAFTEKTFHVTVRPPNAAPSVSALSDRTTYPHRVAGPFSFTIDDDSTVAGDLAVAATSTNAAVVAQAGIALGGVGHFRTITLTPAGALGTTTIRVSVGDGNLTTVRQFNLEVVDGAYTSSGLDRSLVAYYQMNSNTTAAVPDSVGGLDGVRSGANGYSSAAPVRGTYFTTGDGRIAGSSPHVANGSLSVSLWAKAKSSATAARMDLWAQNASSTSTQRISITADHKVEMTLDGVNSVITPTTIVDDHWYHVVGVYDEEAGVQTLFVDGAVVATASAATHPSADSFYLASMSAGSADLLGLDEVAVWQRALAPEEAGQLYGAGTPSFPFPGLASGLMAYYPFDATAGAADVVLDAKTLYPLAGNPALGAPVVGREGGAARCRDGDETSFLAPAGLRAQLAQLGANDFTISTWVNAGNAFAYDAGYEIYPFRVVDSTGITVRALRLKAGGAYAQMTSTPSDGFASGPNAVDFTDGNWHHVVYVHNAGPLRNRIYVDRVLVANSYSAPSDLSAIAGNSYAVELCGHHAPTDPGDTGFAQDETGFWSRALSPTEVLLLNPDTGPPSYADF